jgi:hypothetical protein
VERTSKHLLYELELRYLLAVLKASEGRITNAIVKRSFISISLVGDSIEFAPGAMRIIEIPMIPKATEECFKKKVYFVYE